MTLIITIILCAAALFGQTKDTFPRNLANSASLPATCTVGDVYFRTGVTAGENVYGCTSTNTWTLQSGGGSSVTAGTGIGVAGSTVSIDDTVTATRAQVQSGADTTCVDAGGDDTYACTLTPPLGSYTTGMRLSLKVSTTNTGAATVDAGPGAKTIKTAAGATLADGDIVAGAAVQIAYDGTDFRLVGSSGSGGTSYIALPFWTYGDTNPSDATTYYAGCTGKIMETAAGSRPCYVPVAATLVAVYLGTYQFGTGSNETSTVSIRKNNTTDTTVCSTLDNSSARSTCNGTGLSVSYSAGDYFEIKWVTPTWATNPTTLGMQGVALFTIP
jgi:hypothetical protein